MRERKKGSIKVTRQLIHSDRVRGSYLFALAFIFVLVPVLCRAQAPPVYTITTIAGNCTTIPCAGNYAGDGGPATNAFLFGPSDVILDSSGNVDISDTVNNRIRQLNPSTGIINTVVGNGIAGYAGDGSLATATGAQLANPTSVAVDSAGNMYIADSYNNVVRVVCANQVPIACHNVSAGDINRS